MPSVRTSLEDSVSLIRMLVVQGQIELTDDEAADALGSKLAQWSLNAAESSAVEHDDPDVLGSEMVDWLVEQPEVAEVFVTPLDLLAARADLAWARMPADVVRGAERRPSFAALAEATAAIFEWYLKLARSGDATLNLERLFVLAPSDHLHARVGRLGVDPLVDDPYGPVQPEAMSVPLDPRPYGERGERAVDPTLAECIDLLIVAARLPATAARLAELHRRQTFEVVVYAEANSRIDPFVALGLFGAPADPTTLARKLARG